MGGGETVYRGSPPHPYFVEPYYTTSSLKMAPSTVEPAPLPQSVQEKALTKATRVKQPLTYSNTLDGYQSFDVTPVIGREFPEVQLTDILNASNSDELLRDLAITSRFCLRYMGGDLG